MSTVARVGIDIVSTDHSGPAVETAIARIKRLNAVTESSTQIMGRQRNMVYQVNDVFTSLAGGINPMMVLAQQGPQIAQIYGMGGGGVGAAFRDLKSMLGGLLTRVPVLTAGLAVIGAGLGAMTLVVNRASGETYSYGEVAKATFDVVANYIQSKLNAAWETVAPTVKWVVDTTMPYIKNWVNFLVQAPVAGVKLIVGAFKTLPSVFKLIGQSSANLFLNGMQFLIDNTIGGLNQIIKLANVLNDVLPKELQFGKIGEFSSIKLPSFNVQGTTEEIKKGLAESFDAAKKTFGTDYLGFLYGEIKKQLEANRAASKKPEIKGFTQSGVPKGPNPNSIVLGGEEDRVNLFTMEEQLGLVMDRFKGIRDITDTLKGGVEGFFSSAINGTLTWKGALGDVRNMLSSLASKSFSKLLDMILYGSPGAGSIYGNGGPTGFGGLVGSLFSGIPSFDVGTNYVPRDTLAKVHEGEMIVPEREASAFRRGSGGVNVSINNYSGAQVSARRNAGGGLDIDIRKVVADVIASGDADKAMRRFALQAQPTRR
jgi:hypothetical protein